MNLFYYARPLIHRTAVGLATAGLASIALACSSHSPGGFAGGGSDDGGGSDGGGSVQQQDDSGQSTQGSGDSGLNIMSNNTGTGTCKTGFYSGMFSCYFYQGVEAGLNDAPDSGGVGPVTGTMSFQLTQDITMAGELATTDTASGTFMAATGGFIAADANLGGTLDCAQGQFTGMLTMGVYGLSLGGSPPVPDPNNHFQGPLASMYDGKTSTFVGGQWSMAIAGQGACIGTWSASWMGPGDAGVTDAGGQ